MPATVAAAIASLQVVFFCKNDIVIFIIVKVYAFGKIIITAFHWYYSLRYQ